MNVFEAVKENVTTRQAAELYGIRVNQRGMAVCPFHKDKNPSMKVDRRFHCFACQADGDVIDFTARLFSVTPKEAAEKLSEDFSVPYEKKYQKRFKQKAEKRKLPPEQMYQEMEQRVFRVLSDYLYLLKTWKEIYAPQPEDAQWHPRFVEALQQISYVEYLLDILLFGEVEDCAEVLIDYGREVKALERKMEELIATDAAEAEKHMGGNDRSAVQRESA